jgi:hypothetical protein
VLTLAFSIPMLLTTAVVYNQREYYTGRNLSVKISTANDDIRTATINGRIEYQLELSKNEQFFAQTIAPANYLSWSVDTSRLQGSSPGEVASSVPGNAQLVTEE